MEKILLGLIPSLMVFGSMYWMITMGMREQDAADEFTEEWMKKNGAKH